MRKLLFIAPALADFGHGILLTTLVLYCFGVEPAVWHYLLGLLFSVLPDLDGIKEFVVHGNIDAGEHGDHRDGLHYPLAWALAGAAVIVVDPFIGVLFTLCTLAHFINDSWGTGWGVLWLWPFSKRSYKMFSQNSVDADTSATTLVTSWDPVTKDETARRLGDKDWLVHIYGRVTTISVIEYGTFLIALIVLALFLLWH